MIDRGESACMDRESVRRGGMSAPQDCNSYTENSNLIQTHTERDDS